MESVHIEAQKNPLTLCSLYVVYMALFQLFQLSTKKRPLLEMCLSHANHKTAISSPSLSYSNCPGDAAIGLCTSPERDPLPPDDALLLLLLLSEVPGGSERCWVVAAALDDSIVAVASASAVEGGDDALVLPFAFAAFMALSLAITESRVATGFGAAAAAAGGEAAAGVAADAGIPPPPLLPPLQAALFLWLLVCVRISTTP